MPTTTLRERTLEVFRNSPDTEFSAAAVFEVLQAKDKAVEKNTMLWHITELKKAGAILETRREGHYSILRFGPNPTASAQRPQKASPAAPSVPLRDERTVMRELNDRLIEREALEADIDRLRAELKGLL